MIDHLCFPHIIDLIFDFAPPASLLKMSRVCSEWRHKILERFEHVHYFVALRQDDDSLDLSGRLGATGPEFHTNTASPEAADILRHCRVLDVWCDTYRIELYRIVPKARTVRYWARPPVDPEPPLSTDRLVVFNVDHCEFETPPYVKRLVFVDIGIAPIQYTLFEDFLPSLLGITYIFLGPSGFQDPRWDQCFRVALDYSSRNGVHLTCVNAPPNFKSVILTFAPVYGKEVDRLVRFLELEEYANFIGERDFVTEVVWKLADPPASYLDHLKRLNLMHHLQ